MGWWWSSSESPDREQAKRLSDAAGNQEVPVGTRNPRPAPQSRDEAAFEELRDLFTSINPQAASRAAETVQNPPPPASEEHADSLYPTYMSCTQAFDLAYYCSSMGGQLNNIYRYGGLRSCTEQWKQWRFCMRTKAMGEDEKKRRIREFYMEREAKKRVGRSSERVWDVRTEPIVGAFSKSIEDVEREAGVSVTGT